MQINWTMTNQVQLNISYREISELLTQRRSMVLRTLKRCQAPYRCIYSGDSILFFPPHDKDQIVATAIAGKVINIIVSDVEHAREIFVRYFPDMPIQQAELENMFANKFWVLVEVKDFELMSEKYHQNAKLFKASF